MPFTINEKQQAAVVEISGKFLGSIEEPSFKEALNALKEAGKSHVVVDLTRADFMDSSGIGTLISGLTTLRKAGGDMRLAGLEKRIKSLFLMTRLLGPVFENYASVADALHSYETNPPAPAPAEA